MAERGRSQFPQMGSKRLCLIPNTQVGQTPPGSLGVCCWIPQRHKYTLVHGSMPFFFLFLGDDSTWMRDGLFSHDADFARFTWCLLLIFIWGSNLFNKLVLWWTGLDGSIYVNPIILKLVGSIQFHFSYKHLRICYFSKQVLIMLYERLYL